MATGKLLWALFVNAANWWLLFTGKLVATHNGASLVASLNRIIVKSGSPLIRKGSIWSCGSWENNSVPADISARRWSILTPGTTGVPLLLRHVGRSHNDGKRRPCLPAFLPADGPRYRQGLPASSVSTRNQEFQSSFPSRIRATAAPNMNVYDGALSAAVASYLAGAAIRYRP